MFRTIAALVLIGTQVFAAEDAKPVADFTLADHRGKSWSLADFADREIVVIAVVGTECPLAQKYLPRLQKLSEEFADAGVVFLGINANRQDSLAEIGAQVRTAGVTFPMLKDNRQTVIAALGATRTPEVFVLDKQRVIRYHGRIDDQHAVGNRSKTKATRDDLRIAIQELRKGEPVSVPVTEPVGCLITRSAAPKANAAVTYSNQISRLLQQHCVECHRPGEIGPFSLTDYDEVAGWADMLVEVTQNGQMPPWHASPKHGHFRNARGLTDEEKQLLADWAAAGSPQGNPAELPPPREFTTGWQLPREPDVVIAIRDQPFRVPAEGTVKYQYFAADTHFTEDKWMQAGEIVPGNRAVVHHVIAFVMGGKDKDFDPERNFLMAFVPGLRVKPYPPGYAKRIPAGSKLVFQVHYTTNGTPQEDLSKIGMIFANEADVTHEIRTESVRARPLEIRPHADDQKFEARPVTAPLNLELLSLSPHMHLRGKSFRYELTYPDGRREVLLDVPRYDFNWQSAYQLAEPLQVPKGAILTAFASYDNSANNLANPDPSKTVRWGDQSWDEMMLGYFDIAIPRTAEAHAAAEQIRGMLRPQDQAKRLLESLDKNKNGTIELSEVNERQRPIFNRADKNNDGVVTLEEISAGIVEMRGAVRPQRRE